jgi:hypothetical protein
MRGGEIWERKRGLVAGAMRAMDAAVYFCFIFPFFFRHFKSLIRISRSDQMAGSRRRQYNTRFTFTIEQRLSAAQLETAAAFASDPVLLAKTIEMVQPAFDSKHGFGAAVKHATQAFQFWYHVTVGTANHGITFFSQINK